MIIDYSFWMLFISTAVLLVLTPGPDMIYLVSTAVSHGKKTGVASSFGLATGALVHITCAAIGISAILAASAFAFTVLKILGAGYLFYLGIKAFFYGAAISAEKPEVKQPSSFLGAYTQGILVDVTNPKVALFFVAFLPQFYRPDHGPRALQFMILGLVLIVIGLVIETLIVLFSAEIPLFIKRFPRSSRVLDKILGTVFISLGVKLLFEKQR